MKKSSLLLFFLSIACFVFSQECGTMYNYFKEGAELEYTHYDKKGKLSMINHQKIKQLSTSKDTLVAVMDTRMVDEKGKEMYTGNFPVKCHNGTIYMDMRSIMPAQQNASQGSGMEIEVTGSELVFPPSMKSGQTLPDAEMGMIMRMGGLQMMNTRYFIKNRKVEGEESVTTPAGTYKCLKISYDFEYKLMGTRSLHTLYWYAPEVGMVRSISYDKKGKEESKMELTKFSK